MTNDPLRKNARHLRQTQTEAERLLWEVLRAKRFQGIKFRRQHPVDHFIADFASPELKVIIELDGGYHDYTYEKDKRRQIYLETLGWKVIRILNEDVILDLEATRQFLEQQIICPPP